MKTKRSTTRSAALSKPSKDASKVDIPPKQPKKKSRSASKKATSAKKSTTSQKTEEKKTVTKRSTVQKKTSSAKKATKTKKISASKKTTKPKKPATSKKKTDSKKASTKKTSAAKTTTGRKKKTLPKAKKPQRMTRAIREKSQAIHTQLEDLYPETPIPLDHTDPYTLLVAVLLSAQCKDERVNTITPLLYQRADTPKKMIQLSIEEIQDIIRPCGLSARKSKAIWQLSKILLDEYDGNVPDSIEELEQLPGVGHKTASVVVAQAFGHPAFPVDTHIHRLSARWGLSKGTSVEQTEADLKVLFPKESWNKVHLQFIFFGREHCPARQHDPEVCPICSWAGVQ